MEVRATAKTLRIPPRKARLVLDLIRGKDVEEASCYLQVHTERCGSRHCKSAEVCGSKRSQQQ